MDYSCFKKKFIEVIETKKNKIIPLLVAFAIIAQNPIWPLWLLGNYCILLSYLCIVVILFLLIRSKRKVKIHPSKFLFWGILLIVFVVVPCFYKIRLSSFFIILTFFISSFLKENEKKMAFFYVFNFVYYTVLISLPFWLIHVFVYEFPLFTTIDLDWMKGGNCIMNNYFLFVTNSHVDYFRFYSVYDEPGVLGTISSFLLFVKKYDLSKKINLVIFLGGIFTYSMAFYILSIIGILFYAFSRSLRKNLVLFSVLMVFAIVGFNVLSSIPAFQKVVVYRMENFTDNSIDSRTNANMNSYFEKYITSSQALFGKGTSFLSQNQMGEGASYKLFLIEYGFVGLFLLIGIYICMIPKFTKIVLVFLFLYFLSFLQRPLAFTTWQILLFLCSVSVILSNYITVDDD